VKDRAFTGRDVAEAVRVAAETLGLPEAKLRYFVLDPGRPGGLGVAPTGARIAVLMDADPGERSRAGAARAASPRDETHGPEDDDAARDDLETRLRRVALAIGEATATHLSGTVEDERETVTLRLRSSETAFFLGPQGEGAPLRALEHLLHRMFAPDVHPLKLRVELDGYRDARDEALRARALRLVDEVKRSGSSRETEPLNAYERRIVHLAAAAAGGVVSRSEGEGGDRRVVISRAEDEGPFGEVH
jgi:spoIIIJ-associated protein